MSQFAAMKSGAEMRDHILGKATEGRRVPYALGR